MGRSLIYQGSLLAVAGILEMLKKAYLSQGHRNVFMSSTDVTLLVLHLDLQSTWDLFLCVTKLGIYFLSKKPSVVPLFFAP